MTAFWLILACIAFVVVAGAARGRPGAGVTDAMLLVVLIGLTGVVDFTLGTMFDTGDTGWTLAALLAFGFALDALYGLMAPERQRRRDRRMRELLQRRRA